MHYSNELPALMRKYCAKLNLDAENQIIAITHSVRNPVRRPS